MYVVIKAFSDLQDPVKFREVKEGRLPLRYREYKVGDVYPHPDAPFPTQKRVAELAGSSNKQGTPLIAWVEDQIEDQTEDQIEEPAEEAPEKTAPKRKARAKKE